MSKKEKIKIIKLEPEKNLFNVILKPRLAFIKNQDIEELIKEDAKHRILAQQIKQIKIIKKILNPEKIRLLYTIKHEKPASIYELSKKLNRNLKTVMQDLKILEKAGLLIFKKEKIKNRWHSKPILLYDKLTFIIEI